jgi:histone chaperone ASF1
MAAATITSVAVLNNPAPFADPIALEVTYECLCPLKDDLEWRVVYVGSAESEQHDQVLDSAFVGPVLPGTYKFRMEAPAPDPSKIPRQDLVGVTALLLTCSYRGREFVRVGYYVSTEYPDPEMQENPPEVPVVAKLVRSVLADHPRVTKFPVPFDEEEQQQGVAGGGEAAAGVGGEAGMAMGEQQQDMGMGFGGFGAQQPPPPAGGGFGGGAAFGGGGGAAGGAGGAAGGGGAAAGGGGVFGGSGGPGVGGAAFGGFGQQENVAPAFGAGGTPGMDVDGSKAGAGAGAAPLAVAGLGSGGAVPFGGF